MQINEIVIYSKTDKKRTIELETGTTNIITGKSGTGKSALIDIVEYCLGRTTCHVPTGVIRDNVSWFGLLLTVRKEKIFIARENPGRQGTTNKAFFLRGGNITSPDKIKESNTTSETLVDNLTEIIEISPNLNVPPPNQTRRPLSANIKHALFYCFQKQGEIASEQVLFHRQSEPHTTQDIKDTLPYFLGSIQENALALEQELVIARRELFIAERALKEAELIKGDEISQSSSLIEEARRVGIIPFDKKPETSADRKKFLKLISKWTPEKIPSNYTDVVEELQGELIKTQEKIRKKEYELLSIQKFANELTGYSKELQHQKYRLESIKLYDQDEEGHVCPLCSADLTSKVPNITKMTKSLSSLEKDLEQTNKEKPVLRKNIAKIEGELSELRLEFQQKQKDLQVLIQRQEPVSKIRDQNIIRAQIVGRVNFWLENVRLTDESSELKKDYDTKLKRVSELEKKLDNESKKDRLESTLNLINDQITKYARELELEHSQFPVRLQYSNANIVIDKDDDKVPLMDIGSGENLLGYHLATMFALHGYFVKHKRPIPNFIMLDQPSQVYFPMDLIRKRGGDMQSVTDEDREKMMKFYRFIFKVAKKLAPNFQIIITEHADFDDEEFNSHVRERWRKGKALVPLDWIQRQ